MKFKLWLENDLASWFQGSKIVDSKGRPKRVFHGTTKSGFKTFKLGAPRSTEHESGGLGIWFTDDPLVATEFAHRQVVNYFTEKDPDGTPKDYFGYKHIYGKVHSVYLKITNPKIYAGKDGFEEMMDDRDQFVEYISGVKGKKGYWRTRYKAMNSQEANEMFVQYLKSLGHDGIVIVNTIWDAYKPKKYAPVKGKSNQYVVFDPSQIRSAL